MAKTLTAVTTEVLYRLGDTAEDVWTTAEIQSYLKEAYDLLAILTGFFWDRETLSDVADQATYTLPTKVYEVERVTWNQAKITAMTSTELIELDYQYMTTKGDVEAYVLDMDGLRTLRKYRIPNANGSGVRDTIIEFTRRGSALTGGASQFEFPDQCVKYCRHFALASALERESPGQDLELAGHYKARFEDGVKRVLNRKRKIASQAPRQFGGNLRRRTQPPGPIWGPEFPVRD